MSKGLEIVDQIKAMMRQNGLLPTPANYEFCYRYLAKSDSRLVEAVDSARRSEGRLSSGAIQEIRRDIFGERQEDALATLMEETRSQLAKLSSYVEQSSGDTRAYQVNLEGSRRNLGSAMSVIQQRELLSRIAAATTAMIEKTAQLETSLASSGKEIRTLRRDLEHARLESRMDSLTGLANRKAFDDYLAAHVERSLADHKPLSLIFCDIDHFKLFNDTWGHRMGDEVLRLVGESLDRFCHGIGYPARFGGEEFVITLPGKTLETAGDIAEQFRDYISSHTVRAKQGNRDVGRIAISLGVAQLRWTDNVASLIERADKALYQAKENGRNQTCLEEPLAEPPDEADGIRAA